MCVSLHAMNTSLLVTQDTHHATPSTMADVHAYVDFYFTDKKQDAQQASQSLQYSFQDHPSVYGPISLINDVLIDGQPFPTIDDIQAHLLHYYGSNYMRPDVPSTS